MLVYHSSDQYFEYPDVLHSREALDFGKGFYVTRLKDQAEKYSNRFLRLNKDAYLHVFEFTPNSELKIKIFDSYDEEWLNFVCACRKGQDIYKQYDIIEGGVANDKVFQTVVYIWQAYTIRNRLYKTLPTKCQIIRYVS